MSQEIGIVLLGIIAGIMSGMFGIGGGVIIVPILTAVFAFPLIEAGGTSLAALMMPVGIFAVMSYYREKMINIKVAAIFSLGILVGVLFGANFAISLPAALLKQIYGIFLLWVCWRFFDFRTKKQANETESDSINSTKILDTKGLIKICFWGIFTGILSGLFGIGGGLVMVPIMVTVLKFDTKTAVGTSLAALLPPVAFPGVLAYYYAGHLNVAVAAILAAGLVVGSLFGAKINIALPSKSAKKLYAVFLLIMSINFIVSGFWQ